MNDKKGVLFVILGGIFWGTAGLFVRLLEKAGFESIQMAFARLTVTAVLILAIVLIYDKRLLKIKLKDIWVFLGSGIISVLFFSLCYYETMEYAPVSVAVVLLYTAPVFVMLMSCLFFKERMTLKKVLACISAFGGCLLISGVIGVGNVPLRAIITGVLSGLGYALYSIFGKIAINKGYHSFTVTVYTFIIAAVGSIPFANVGQMPALIRANVNSIAVMVLFAVVNALLPYLFYTMGLSRIESGRASIFASVEPVVATLIGTFFLQEHIDIYGAVGIGLVIFAVVLLNIKDKKALHQ